ncbi:MAG: hypothetical protein ABSF23_01240 [Terracidiphilus sp.]|jgi:hypothetical protein
MIEIAFLIGDEGGEHLLYLRGERQENVVCLGGLECVVEVLLMKQDPEGWGGR